MKKRKYLLITALSFIIQFEVTACDCAVSPKTFVQSLKEYTAELEVVSMDTILKEENFPANPIILSKLKVVKVFNGIKSDKYIWMYNASGTDCMQGIHPDSIGQRYIITGFLYSDKKYYRWIGDDLQRTFLHASTCGKPLLTVSGDTVIGMINENNEQKIREEYNRLKVEDEKKADAYINNIYHSKYHKALYQRMPINEFYSLMEGLTN